MALKVLFISLNLINLEEIFVQILILSGFFEKISRFNFDFINGQDCRFYKFCSNESKLCSRKRLLILILDTCITHKSEVHVREKSMLISKR